MLTETVILDLSLKLILIGKRLQVSGERTVPILFLMWKFIMTQVNEEDTNV